MVQADWSRLLGVGLAFIFIGLMMVMVNTIISDRQCYTVLNSAN